MPQIIYYNVDSLMAESKLMASENPKASASAPRKSTPLWKQPPSITSSPTASCRLPPTTGHRRVRIFIRGHAAPAHMTDMFRNGLKYAIRKGLSNKHAPRLMIEVNEIPMTVNGKKVEALVRGIISSGKSPEKVSNTVANPGCLGAFQRFIGLEMQWREAKLQFMLFFYCIILSEH